MTKLEIKEHELIHQKKSEQTVEVTVCVSLYNYQDYIVETLESIYYQSLEPIDLIIVDDHSTDWSAIVAQTWLEQRQNRFNQVKFVKHNKNCGLSSSRNTAVSLSNTPFVFIIDADNLLYSRCLDRCLEVIKDSKAAFTYPILEKFGESKGIIGNLNWNIDRLARSNYIDAMALISKAAIEEVGGYSQMYYGWEDYDLWCQFAEKDYYGVLVPEILARYRVHQDSMLNSITNKQENLSKIVEDMTERHPWLKLVS